MISSLERLTRRGHDHCESSFEKHEKTGFLCLYIDRENAYLGCVFQKFCCDLIFFKKKKTYPPCDGRREIIITCTFTCKPVKFSEKGVSAIKNLPETKRKREN